MAAGSLKGADIIRANEAAREANRKAEAERRANAERRARRSAEIALASRRSDISKEG